MAIARALTLTGDFDVTVLEKERRVAAHQTGHNSGVVHAGLYYQPGSLKAVLWARGRTLTRDYCQAKGLPYRELGKLVVAVTTGELPRLDEIERRARENRVPGVRRLDAAGLREIEPHAAGVAAVHSPETAVVDYAAITEAMAQDVRQGGGSVLLGQEVVAVAHAHGLVHLSTPAGTHTFDRLVVCAGLQSDVVAKLVGARPSPMILPFRGECWLMAAQRSHLVRGMIYPVPDPRFPLLGVHFTRGVYDDVQVGPNAVPALAREVSASLLKPRYFRQARQFLPALRPADLAVKAGAGVRAQAWAADGSLLDDFAVDQLGAVTLLRNAPSPAATSALAIAGHILEHCLQIPARR